MSEIKYGEMEWSEGAVVLPGLKRNVYAIPKRDIVEWPTLPDEFTTSMGEMATYAGKFTLAAGATFKKIGIIVDKSPVNCVTQGTKPSKTSINTGTFVHPDVEEVASAYCRQSNNDDMVYLFETKKGKFRVLGNEMWESDTAFSQALGGSPTDEVGTTLTVTVTDVCPAPFYVGEIVTADGIINEAD
jgi:hypothetical protein